MHRAPRGACRRAGRYRPDPVQWHSRGCFWSPSSMATDFVVTRNGVLGRGIRRHERQAPHRRRRGKIDDRALACGQQMRNLVLHAQPCAAHIDGEEIVEILGGNILHRAGRSRNAGVVHRDIKTTEFLHGGIHHCRDRFLVAHIDRDKTHLAAACETRSRRQACHPRTCFSPAITTFAPASAMARAHARPIPESAPTMRARRPLMENWSSFTFLLPDNCWRAAPAGRAARDGVSLLYKSEASDRPDRHNSIPKFQANSLSFQWNCANIRPVSGADLNKRVPSGGRQYEPPGIAEDHLGRCGPAGHIGQSPCAAGLSIAQRHIHRAVYARRVDRSSRAFWGSGFRTR